MELQDEQQRAQGSLEGNSSSSTIFFFFPPRQYLETAALITANNLDLIFGLSKNVIIDQQLEQSKYYRKFFAGPSCKNIHDFFVCLIFSFCLLFSLCPNKKMMLLFTKIVQREWYEHLWYLMFIAGLIEERSSQGRNVTGIEELIVQHHGMHK